MIPKILNTTDRIFSHFGPFFALYFLTFEKMKKKTPGDIIILQKSTINDNHMIYGS